MPKDQKPSDKGRVKVRVIEFELEGSNQTLRDSIRDIVGAIGPVRQARTISSTGSSALGQSPSAAAQHSPDDDVEDLEEVADESQGESEPEILSAQQTRRPRSRPRTPKPVPVDLRGEPFPLREFMANAPSTIDERYTLIAYWFKLHRNKPEISADHIFTAFTEMNWTSMPRDAGQPLRKLKVEGWFDKGETPGTYALNHIGQGKAVDMLSASADKK